MGDYNEFQMPLAEAMTTQRAIRRIKPDPVDDALVLRLIELALKGPTAQNQQHWEFIIVKDPEIKRRLGRQNRIMWNLYRPFANWKSRNDPKAQKLNTATQWGVDRFEEIPVYVVACFRGSRFAFPPVVAASTYGSIFPAVQNLLLAAGAAGLGANINTMPLWSSFAARRILGLPFSITPCVLIPLGWPLGRYGPTTRKPVGEVVSLDQFDNRPRQQKGADRETQVSTLLRPPYGAASDPTSMAASGLRGIAEMMSYSSAPESEVVLVWPSMSSVT